MNMYLSKGESIRLVRKKMIKSKSGKDLCFVKVAHTSTFENVEFMLDMDNCDPFDLQEGKDYDLVVQLEDKYVNAVLLPLTAK